MKKIFMYIVFIFVVQIEAQNNQILYNFAELPQTMLLNPGAENNYKFHVGVPLLSGNSLKFGSSGFSLTDIFAEDNIPINTKISALVNNLSPNDFVMHHSQVEVLNVGFRLNNTTYFSFGFYEEIDAFGYYPKDVFLLFTEGNASNLNKNFSASQIAYKLDALGALHVGITKTVNDQLTLGGRFKIYSSALNIESNNNTGIFTTTQGTNNIYTHYLTDIDVSSRTSGLVDAEGELIEDENTYLKNTFFGANMGIGFDVGFTHHLSEQLQISGSVLDVGFIHHKNNIQTTSAKGDFVFDGMEFAYDPNGPVNYWNQLNQRFKEQLPTTQDEDSYISWRPAKVNGAVLYSFGEKRSDICFDNTFKDFYRHGVGMQVNAVFRPLRPQLALTAFYQSAVTAKLHTKIAYTIDAMSSRNLGVGASAQLGRMNFYGMIDNILEFQNLTATQTMSIQFGANLIFN